MSHLETDNICFFCMAGADGIHGRNEFQLYQLDNTIYNNWAQVNTWQTLSATYVIGIAEDRWPHCVVTYDGTNRYLYYDGVQVYGPDPYGGPYAGHNTYAAIGGVPYVSGGNEAVAIEGAGSLIVAVDHARPVVVLDGIDVGVMIPCCGFTVVDLIVVCSFTERCMILRGGAAAAGMLRCAVVIGGVMLHYEVTAGSTYAEGVMILLYEVAVGDVSAGSEVAKGGMMVRRQVAVVDMIVGGA